MESNIFKELILDTVNSKYNFHKLLAAPPQQQQQLPNPLPPTANPQLPSLLPQPIPLVLVEIHACSSSSYFLRSPRSTTCSGTPYSRPPV
ncbi:1766_t:CDS:2 [Ambispora gerdemannii]|uniref:1766_t:CDS:1 n=1 Tax=Ambispora gerdemannii TaxID=144530 RepID=A0A9N8YMT9_9GLOM|nr:1766_t:CDS:2 [Ambispora gerdemannii]